MRLALCEDDAVFRAWLRRHIETEYGGEYRSSEFDSLGDLRAAVDGGFRPDIAIMDIELPDGSGIDAVRELFPGGDTQVIYLTGYHKYCSDVYETEHVYFLLKPVDAVKLGLALGKARARLERRGAETLSLRSGPDVYRLQAHEILYIESNGRKLRIVQDNGALEIYSTLSAMLRELPDCFIQCHKSFVVNLKRARSLEHAHFVMDKGQLVPVSRKRYQTAKDRFLRYIGEQL